MPTSAAPSRRAPRKRCRSGEPSRHSLIITRLAQTSDHRADTELDAQNSRHAAEQTDEGKGPQPGDATSLGLLATAPAPLEPDDQPRRQRGGQPSDGRIEQKVDAVHEGAPDSALQIDRTSRDRFDWFSADLLSIEPVCGSRRQRTPLISVSRLRRVVSNRPRSAH